MLIKYDSSVVDHVPKSEYYVVGKYVRRFVCFYNSLVDNYFDSQFIEFLVHENYSYVGEHLRLEFYTTLSNRFPDYVVRFRIEDDLIILATICYYPKE